MMKMRAANWRKRRRGLALIEVLICASVAAMMLTTTAMAFRASVMAFRDNTDRNMLLSHGRIAMRQLIGEIRQGDIHGPINDDAVPHADTQFASGLTTEDGGIQILKTRPDADEPAIIAGSNSTYVLLTWRYDAPNRRILRTRSVGGANAVTSTEALYVQDFKVRMEPARSAANVASGDPSFDLLLRAVVTMTLQNQDPSGTIQFSQGSGQVTERIIDAAVPRKNFSGL
jgi:hypothetical protein